jgi:signal transduction histidine kinase
MKDFKPEVVVSTRQLTPPSGGRGVEISVKDNGAGIPESVKGKIFQPFFTTKPTGSGTGLGLSLSYDIVKAHGGDIKVNSKDGEGTEFIIQLPGI